MQIFQQQSKSKKQKVKAKSKSKHKNNQMIGVLGASGGLCVPFLRNSKQKKLQKSV